MSQICDDIGLIEVIDRRIPPDPNQKLSHGEYVKLMVINGLGFPSRPLYLEVQFFSSKKEIGAEYEIYKNASANSKKSVFRMCFCLNKSIRKTLFLLFAD